MSITTDMLHELFYYKDGKLYNKVDRGTTKANAEVGCRDNNGYTVTKINGKRYYAHRLIYILVHGHIPNNLFIDHIDGNPSNNQVENLRVVVRQGNDQNRRRAKGYRYKKGAWEASIKHDGKQHYLGRYTTEDEARQAHLEAKKKLHAYTPNDYFGDNT